jgi:hypothetical protein
MFWLNERRRSEEIEETGHGDQVEGNLKMCVLVQSWKEIFDSGRGRCRAGEPLSMGVMEMK